MGHKSRTPEPLRVCLDLVADTAAVDMVVCLWGRAWTKDGGSFYPGTVLELETRVGYLLLLVQSSGTGEVGMEGSGARKFWAVTRRYGRYMDRVVSAVVGNGWIGEGIIGREVVVVVVVGTGVAVEILGGVLCLLAGLTSGISLARLGVSHGPRCCR